MNEDTDPNAPENFEAEIKNLIALLRSELGEGKSRWYYDDQSETLYIELESLHSHSEEAIEQKAGPVLEECDLDFEEIILLPFTD